jgi:hypothetical protein
MSFPDFAAPNGASGAPVFSGFFPTINLPLLFRQTDTIKVIRLLSLFTL